MSKITNILAGLKIKSCLTLIIVTFIIFIFLSISFLNEHDINNNLDYCKDVSDELSELNLDCFQCISIDKADYQHTQFYFRSESHYETYECPEEIYLMDDILKIRNFLSKYLAGNPSNKLNNDLIICTFELYPGNCMYMYNYDFQEEAYAQQPVGFLYFKNIFIDLADAQAFADAHIIDVTICNLDDIIVLEKWKYLKSISLVGPELDEKTQKYLIDMLPNSTIVYNWKTINKGDF